MVCIVNELRENEAQCLTVSSFAYGTWSHSRDGDEIHYLEFTAIHGQFMKCHTGRQIQMAQELIMMERGRKMKRTIMFKTAQT
jgi:hypothetical protein